MNYKFILFFLLIIPFISYEQIDSSLTHLSLQDAIHTAIQHKGEIRINQLDEITLQTTIAQYKSKYIPNINGQVNIIYNPIIPTSLLPIKLFNPNATSPYLPIQIGSAYQNTAGFQLEQPIYDPNISALIKEKKAEATKLNIQKQITTEDIIDGVVSAYLSLLLSNAELTWLAHDTMRMQVDFSNLEHQTNAGTSLKQDENIGQYNIEKARYNYQIALLRQQQFKENLLYAMGMPIQKSASLNPTTSIEEIITIPISTDTSYTAQRTDFKLLDYQQHYNKLKIEDQKKTLLPTVTFNAYYGGNNISNSFSLFDKNFWYGNSFVGVKLNIPITHVFENNQIIHEYQIQNQQNTLQEDILRKKMQYDLSTENKNNDIAQLALQLSKKNVQLMEKDVMLKQNQFNAGTILYNQVIQSENNLSQANYDFIQQLYQCASTYINIIKKEGKLLELLHN